MAGMETDGDHAVLGSCRRSLPCSRVLEEKGAQSIIGYGRARGGCRLSSLVRLLRARTGEPSARIPF